MMHCKLMVAPATIALLLWAGRASAVYQCGDQTDDCKCGADDPYPCCSNGGNCTWWAWEAACCNWAVALPGWGNANQWVGNAAADPDYEVLTSPVVGSIACKVSGTYGHVAWVTAVNGSQITVTEENCCTGCNYGMRTYTYEASHFDGGFIVRKSQCECTDGQTQSGGCDKCGTHTRTCGATCAWNDWGDCTSQGACNQGDTDEQACGDCGKHIRTCGDDCQWGNFGACTGPDPDGGSQACDTGLKGVCAAGVSKCVEGTLTCEAMQQASAEVCDNLDNNCNGQVDEGVCGDGGTTSKDGGTGKDGGTEAGDAGRLDGGQGGNDGGAASGTGNWNQSDDGGCTCRAGNGRSTAPWAALAALTAAVAAYAHRRRRG